MRKRSRMSRHGSRKSFSRTASVHHMNGKNFMGGPSMRGGIRL